jgi:hypothetical protein
MVIGGHVVLVHLIVVISYIQMFKKKDETKKAKMELTLCV